MPKKSLPVRSSSQKRLESFNFKVERNPDSQNNFVAQVSLFSYLPPIRPQGPQHQNLPNPLNIHPPRQEEMEIEEQKASSQAGNQEPLEQSAIPSNARNASQNAKKNEDAASNRPDHNATYTYQQKYDTMKGILDYLAIEGPKDKIIKLCEDLGKKNNVKPKTVNQWFYQLKKDPSIIHTVGSFCFSKRSAQSKGQIKKKSNVILACSPEMEQQIIDWTYFCWQIGIQLCPDHIKLKAKTINKNPSFKASNQWLKGFFF